MLQVESISFSYDKSTVVNAVSFTLQRGEIGCLLGPSGSGKTTTLRLLAGFSQLEAGKIRLHESMISDSTSTVPPEHRKVGMVFQDYALFPHLTVAQNVAFGISSAPDKAQRVEELLALVGLKEWQDAYPHTLSGGQQQRVAIARALAPKPDLLLFDEPFSSLDVALREQLAQDIRRILKSENTTALMVTHDQQEAFAMADKIGVMFDGTLHQWAEPESVYCEPSSDSVAKFIGDTALVDISLFDEEKDSSNKAQFVAIRPQQVSVNDDGKWAAIVTNSVFCGAYYRIALQLKEFPHISLPCLVSTEQAHSIGDTVSVDIDLTAAARVQKLGQ